MPTSNRRKTIYSSDYELFLRLLAQARQETGMTQAELAKALRVDQSTISKGERGERRMDIVQARDWCRAMGISFAKLMAEFDAKASRGLHS